jgi:hypothetical protein
VAFNQFNRVGHQALSAKIKTALDTLGQQLGLQFDVGGGSIALSSLTIKIVASADDPAAVAEQKSSAFASQCGSFGLMPDDFGAVFVSQGKRYKLTEIKAGRPKYPLVADCVSSGRSFKMGLWVVPAIIAARTFPAFAGVAPAAAAPVGYDIEGMF